jgi:hypothetical protein
MVKKKRYRGHFCKVCRRILPNEKFSGKGHAAHICKKCAKKQKEQQTKESAKAVMKMVKYEIKLEHLFEVVGYVTAPIPIGPSSWGVRLIFPIVEGMVKGPRVNGKFRPFGADWGLIRGDNCLELDVRSVIETDDGALIHTYYNGIVDMTKEQVDKIMVGEIPHGLDFYVTPRFETSNEKYQWLTRIQTVGRGSVEPEGDRLKVSYSWYVLTG